MTTMQKHPPELKNKIIGRMMPPTNESIRTLSRETGISEPTLHQWRTQARKNGFAVPADGKESDRWSPQDKFLIVMQTYPMNETELAEYCRSKGLYAEQIEAWRDACLQANGGVAKQSAALQQELKTEKKRSKELEKELRRKESALAETAALLTLRRKARGSVKNFAHICGWGPA